MRFTILMALAAATSFNTAANATFRLYLASDRNVTSFSQMTNSAAAADAFTSKGSFTVVDFETPVPDDFLIDPSDETPSFCTAACGFNTTVGGSSAHLKGLSIVIQLRPATNANAFGFFLTGLNTDVLMQTTGDERIPQIARVGFTDNSFETFRLPDIRGDEQAGAGLFVGLTDSKRRISSFTLQAEGDILSIDDVRYGFVPQGVIPEPASWAMMIAGFGLVGMAARRRRPIAAAA